MKLAATPSSSGPVSLSVRGLTVAIGGRLVIEDVSLSAQPGAVTAVLGEAGAGKTSLLAGIAGLMKPERGAVLVGGTDATRVRPGRRDIGFLPPGTDLGAARPIAGALKALAPHGCDAARMAELLALFGLASAAGRRLGDIGHGEAFACLAAARLLPQGAVLLVDEAGTGLTEDSQAAMLGWLRAEAATGRTVLLATRSRALALAADHLVLLQQGRVLQAGAPASVHAEPRDAAAALMTGPANLLRGTLRQKLPGGFVWMAAGSRFTQADSPGHPTPPLGSDILLCLRPRDLHVGPAPDAANSITGVVTQLVCRGAQTELFCETPLDPLRAVIDGPPPMRTGMAQTLCWLPNAAVVLPTA